MAQDIDFLTAPWIPGTVIDPGTPTDVPYTLFDDAWYTRPLIEVIGETARRIPEQIAIDDGAIRLSYAQLYAMACRVSHAISRAELPPGAIGIKVSYDALHPVAIIGCLAAGRPCLLMNKNHPADFNRRLAERAGLKGLLVNAADARDGSVDGELHSISIEAILMTGGDVEGPSGRLGFDDPAFILSTSGSTGIPKLIARSQRRLQQSTCSNIETQRLNENDRILIIGAMTNGSAIRGLGYLMVGSTVHLVDVSRAGMGRILRVVRDKKITILGTTVSVMKTLSKLDDARAYLASLRVVSVGGEMMLQKDMAQIRAALPPGCRLSYSLAMTEATVAKWFVPENDEHDLARVAVGYIAVGTEVLLVDDEGRPCAPGEVGELIVRSQKVALGEWADGRIVPNRFQSDAADSSKRIYRTGDLARLCADGVMVVHGRKDRMVKIRGQRVEPAVVEAAIRNVPGVADAVVGAQQDNGDVRIYGFVARGPQAGANLLTDVREALKTALPSYMWPSDILIVESLPTNAAGKVDLKSLLALIRSPDDGRVTVDAAPSDTQHPATDKARGMVADAWRVALGATRGESSLAFDMVGGDSLQFMQIIFRIEQLSRVSFPLGIFDVSMTREDMARRLDALLGGRSASQAEGAAEGTPIFFFPGVGGDEPRLLQFRAGCAPDISFRCLDYGDWTQWAAPGFRFEALIDRLVAQIQEMAPKGPLTLAGYSLGGQVSLVVAARLHASGRAVTQLLILDSAAIKSAKGGSPAQVAERPPTRRQEFREWRVAQRRGEGAFALALIATRRLVSPRWAPLLRWLARHRRTVLPGQIDFYLSFHIHRSWLLQLAAEWRGRLPQSPRISVPITVFRTSHSSETADNAFAGWSQHSPLVTLVPIEGDHFTMFDAPHIADLCADFKEACLLHPLPEVASS